MGHVLCLCCETRDRFAWLPLSQTLGLQLFVEYLVRMGLLYLPGFQACVFISNLAILCLMLRSTRHNFSNLVLPLSTNLKWHWNILLFLHSIGLAQKKGLWIYFWATWESWSLASSSSISRMLFFNSSHSAFSKKRLRPAIHTRADDAEGHADDKPFLSKMTLPARSPRVPT